jgi:hypothetical protein
VNPKNGRMEESLYIDKDIPLKEGADYYALRKQGIAAVQEMAGTIWTDYNEHDPGVTILEQLCYALTSLFYLTEIPLSDLLINKNSGRLDTNRQALFIPKDIYPCNPWTADDYRKLLLDRLPWLGNIWFLPAALQVNGVETSGLYKVLLYIPAAIGQIPVKEEVHKIYAAHRCLCEDLHSVQVLKNRPVQLYADVAVSGDITPESLLAQLFFEISLYMAPEIRRHSLDDVLEQGLSADEIFEGPLLMNGFITGDELQPKADILYVNQIEKKMLGIKGIENIRNVYLKDQGLEFRQKMIMPEDSICVLNTVSPFSIRLYKKGVEYLPDAGRVKKELAGLYQGYRLRYKLDASYETYFGVPAGQYRPVENYHSIQNQFPAIYGINKFGLLKSDPPERKAWAKQLKGYLLVFEQLMADFHAQLAHVDDLFSIDPAVQHTYFCQGLEEIVPDIKPVLKGNYEKGLKNLISRMDDYTDRRNRFLDFLLALYAEKISFWSISPYTDCCSDQTPSERLIQAKLRFLKHLVVSTRDRGKACDYSGHSIPGMEWKIRILLGMPVPPAGNLSGEFKSKGFRMVHASDEKINKVLPLSQTPPDQIKNYETVTGDTNVLLNTIPLGKEGVVDEAFITYGSQLHHYRMGLMQSSTLWEVLFRPGETSPWKTIGQFNNREEAAGVPGTLAAPMQELDCCFNRMYIIEHSLLRHALQSNDRSLTLPEQNSSRLSAFCFGFHISVIFCGSSRLIDNEDYRTFAENTVAENTPAHIMADYYWLSPWQLWRFELLYNDWKSELASPEKRPDQLKALSKDMISFLQECHKPIS